MKSVEVTALQLAKEHEQRQRFVTGVRTGVILAGMGLIGLGLYGHWKPEFAWVALGLSFLLLPASWWAARLLFRLRVEELDMVRGGEAVWSDATTVAKQKGK